MRSDSAALPLEEVESVELRLVAPLDDVAIEIPAATGKRHKPRVDGLIALAELGRATGARC